MNTPHAIGWAAARARDERDQLERFAKLSPEEVADKVYGDDLEPPTNRSRLREQLADAIRTMRHGALRGGKKLAMDQGRMPRFERPVEWSDSLTLNGEGR